MTSSNIQSMSDSLILFSSDDEESDSHYELKHYENLTAMLKGVPPPSSITISRLTVEEMLQKYHENKETYGFGLESCKAYKSSKKNPVPFLNYLNSSPLSETIASLSQKVQERYIQMETMSSCNTWFKATLEECGSAKKRLRMRQTIGLSPSRRLSHLARRRQFFSSANLQRLANAENVRQIELKRNNNREDARKKLNRTIESEKLKSSKRALFQSPENGTPTKYGNTVPVNRRIYSSESDEKRKIPLQERSKKVEVLKWLSQQNFEVDFPRKRPREECANHSVERKRKCPRRSLNFADDDASSNAATSESNNSTDKRTFGSGKLSEIHKNKLLWAVSVVLKENNIIRKDENFKSLAAKLFFRCRTNLDEILNSNVAEGTSDKILYYARKIIPSVFDELGIKSKLPSEKNSSEKTKNEEPINNESKENIDRSNVDDVDQQSNFPKTEIEFVFKTPRKVIRKRMVKSCQKAPTSGRKRRKNVLRTWRSLELLIDDVENSMSNIKTDGEVVQCRNCGTCKNGDCVHVTKTINKPNILEDKVDLSKNYLLSSEGVENVPSVIPRLPSVDTTVIFSPIPSSVKEESENDTFISLPLNQTNPEHTEASSDENNSMEIINQDEDLEKEMEEGRMFSEEYSNKHGSDNVEKEATPLVENNIVDFELLSPIKKQNEIMQSVNPSACNTGTVTSFFRQESDKKSKAEGMFNTTAFTHNKAAENEEEEEENDANRNMEETEPSTPECTSKMEKATYKPRKLVVKKSKPNWKVVRKDPDEAEEESELRLKMRLSHEWEIVCRNSSCSDIGNSEHEGASMNCSQMSNTTDKEISSECEAEDSSRRSSDVSRCDGTTEEELSKSKALSKNKDCLQTDVICSSDMSCNENEESNCDVTPQNPLNESEQLSQNDVVTLNETDDSMQHEKSFNENADCNDVDNDDSNVGTYSENVNGLLKELGDSSVRGEICRPNEERIISVVEYNPFDRPLTGTGIVECSDEDTSSVEKSSNKGNFEKNCNTSPEVEEEGSYFPSMRNTELKEEQSDSENGISASSTGRERKKKFLSLENYKARKMEEVSNDVNSKRSNDESEPPLIETNVKKKIYNIRLKHPIGHHKHKRKHKDRSKERHRKHKYIEIETDKASTSNRRQFTDGFCDGDSSTETRNRAETICNPNPKDVNVQTIVDALSTLSNLVSEQIKLENDKMMSEKGLGENGLKRSKWLDVVSSWCGKNLSSLNLTPNDSSPVISGLNDENVAAVKKMFGISLPSDSSSNTGSSPSTENLNRMDPRMNFKKTEPNVVQDHLMPNKMNLAYNSEYNNSTLVNTGMNMFQNSLVSSSVRLSGNDACLQNYSVFPTCGSHSRIESCSGYNEPHADSANDNMRMHNGADQQLKVQQTLKKAHHNFDYWSGSSQSLHGVATNGLSNCVKYNSPYPSTSSSMQASYQYSSNYLTTEKPSFYHSHMYGNYPNWQMSDNVNYQHGMSDGYQNPSFYPYQMPSVSYYYNKY